jgi:hypothetical protein
VKVASLLAGGEQLASDTGAVRALVGRLGTAPGFQGSMLGSCQAEGLSGLTGNPAQDWTVVGRPETAAHTLGGRSSGWTHCRYTPMLD